MKKICLLCLAYFGLFLTAQALHQGMSPTTVVNELGKPISNMEIADRSIWLYKDGRKLEFESEKLVKVDGLVPQTTTSLLKDSRNNDTRVKLSTLDQDLTITESHNTEKLLSQVANQNYDLGPVPEDLSQAIKGYESSHGTSASKGPQQHMRDVLIGFILELVLTYIVLQVAFSLIGFPSLFQQIFLLSLAVALAGATLEYLLYIGLFNPIRIGLSFILLLLLIRQFTDVREWATAIQIALLARFISLALMWASFAGLMVLFGL